MSRDLANENAAAPRQKSVLSAQRRRLVELLQEIRFGEIEELLVFEGEPQLVPPPRTKQTVLLGRPFLPHPARDLADFALPQELIQLFALFDKRRSMRIIQLEVHDGLPRKLTLAGTVVAT